VISFIGKIKLWNRNRKEREKTFSLWMNTVNSSAPSFPVIGGPQNGQNSNISTIFRKILALQPVYAAGAPEGGEGAKKRSPAKSIVAGGVAGKFLISICFSF